MQRCTRWMVMAMALVAAIPSLAHADNFILYMHGRGDTTWSRSVVKAPGWTNVTMSYDGNARLDEKKVSELVESTFQKYCSGDNACVVTCHSAGCMRTLKAVDSLTAAGQSLNILWVAAAGSAAGGTALAELSTNLVGGVGIDRDLRRDRARSGTGWAHIQDAMTSSVMYHVAGRRDSCRYRVCGNWFLPSGACDGLVCMDSAGGGSQPGEYFDGCKMPLYPGRIYDQSHAECEGADVNHNDTAFRAMSAVETRVRK